MPPNLTRGAAATTTDPVYSEVGREEGSSARRAGVASVGASPALAGDWLPHPADATWTYAWTDTDYQQTPTKEKVTVKSQKGASFMLAWTTEDEASPTPTTRRRASARSRSRTRTPASSTPTGRATRRRSGVPDPLRQGEPVRQQPREHVLQRDLGRPRAGARRAAAAGADAGRRTGGAGNDVTSSSRYLGHEQVTVPAFPTPVHGGEGADARSRRRARSATRTAAACARSGGSTASAR